MANAFSFNPVMWPYKTVAITVSSEKLTKFLRRLAVFQTNCYFKFKFSGSMPLSLALVLLLYSEIENFFEKISKFAIFRTKSGKR